MDASDVDSLAALDDCDRGMTKPNANDSIAATKETSAACTL